MKKMIISFLLSVTIIFFVIFCRSISSDNNNVVEHQNGRNQPIWILNKTIVLHSDSSVSPKDKSEFIYNTNKYIMMIDKQFKNCDNVKKLNNPDIVFSNFRSTAEVFNEFPMVTVDPVILNSGISNSCNCLIFDEATGCPIYYSVGFKKNKAVIILKHELKKAKGYRVGSGVTPTSLNVNHRIIIVSNGRFVVVVFFGGVVKRPSYHRNFC